MQLRRAVPLTLLALLTSAGCVSTGPHDGDPARAAAPVPAPAQDSVPPAGDAERPSALPLSPLASTAPRQEPDGGPGSDASPPPSPAGAAAAPSARPGKPAAAARRPRPRPAKPASPHPHRRPAAAPRPDELCAAAEGVVPPSIVDLCLRQYGR